MFVNDVITNDRQHAHQTHLAVCGIEIDPLKSYNGSRRFRGVTKNGIHSATFGVHQFMTFYAGQVGPWRSPGSRATVSPNVPQSYLLDLRHLLIFSFLFPVYGY